MVSRRLTQLTGAIGRRRTQSRSDNTNVSGSSHALGTDFPSAIGEASDPPDPTSEEPQQQSAQATPRKRGRPKSKLQPSTLRGYIRLFVEASKTPFEHITTAFHDSGGRGRLWSRHFFEDTTGAGRKGDLDLDDLRYKGDEPDIDNEVDDDDAATLEGPAHPHGIYQDLVDEPDRSLRAVGTSPVDLSADEQEERRKFRRRDVSRDIADGDNDKAGHPRSLTAPHHYQWSAPNAAGKHVKTTRESLAADDLAHWSAIGANFMSYIGPQMAQQDFQRPDAQQSVRFSESPSTSQPKKRKLLSRSESNGRGENDKEKLKRKPRRRSTTLSLSSMAVRLDGGIRGFHFRIAKQDTITAPRSSPTTEFNRFYRAPTWMNVVPPTASTHPISPSALPLRKQYEPPRSAVAIRILTKAWSKRLCDAAVAKELEQELPEPEAERNAFVNTADHLKVSPLHLAVAYGYPHVCQLLYRQGANVQAVTSQGTNIYHFAESAARRAGDDMGLYFRILHCRRFVCAGELPPAPKRIIGSNDEPKKKGPRPAAEALPASDLGNIPIPDPFVPGTAPPYDETQQWPTAIQTNVEYGSRRPSFATELTESPTLSSRHDQYEPALGAGNITGQQYETHTSTTPFPPDSSYYADPPSNVQGVGQLESNVGMFGGPYPVPTPNAEASQKHMPPYGHTHPWYGTNHSSSGGYAWTTQPQQPDFHNYYAPEQPPTTQGLSPSSFALNTGYMNYILPLAPVTTAPSQPTSSLGPATSAHTDLHLAIPTASVAHGHFLSNHQSFGSMQPDPTTFQPNEITSTAGSANRLQGHRPHPVDDPPHYHNTPIVPQSTNTGQPPVSVPVSTPITYSTVPTYPQTVPSNHQSILDNTFACPFGDQTCPGIRICAACLRRYGLS